MKETERIHIFEEISPGKAAVSQILPAVASQMVLLVYNLTDTYFVGMLNSPAQTSALQVVYPCFTFLNAVSCLFGVGAAAMVAKALGRRDNQAAASVSSVSFWWGMLASVALSALFVLLEPVLLPLCGATAENSGIVYDYAFYVVTIGAPFAIGSSILSNLERGQGSAKVASFGISMGAVLNIVLDPFFVLPQYLNLGAEGAGIATCVSNAASFLYFLIHILSAAAKDKRETSGKTTVLSFRLSELKQTKAYLGKIIALGIPSSIQHCLGVVAVAAQTKFVSRYTVEAVAALGIVKKLDQLPLYFAFGCGSGLLPILTYNYTSGNRKRCGSIFRTGIFISVGFCTLCTIAYEIFAPSLAGIFIKDDETIRLGADFLRCMVLAMPFMSFCNPMVTFFQSVGQPQKSTLISVLRKGTLDIPLLFLWDALFPLYGCMLVQPTIDIIAMVVTLCMYQNFCRKEPEFYLFGGRDRSQN